MIRETLTSTAALAIAASASALDYLPLGYIDDSATDTVVVSDIVFGSHGGKPIIIKPVTYGAHFNELDDTDYIGVSQTVTQGPGLTPTGNRLVNANPNAASETFGWDGWDQTSEADARATGDYIQFGFEVDTVNGAAVKFDPNSLDIDLRGPFSGGGNNLAFDISVDGGSWERIGLRNHSLQGTTSLAQLAIPDLPQLEAVSKVEFRAYVYNLLGGSALPSNRANPNGDFELNGRDLFNSPSTFTPTGFTNTFVFQDNTAAIVLGGSIVIPEPGSVAVLGLGGALISGRRRRA